MFEPTAKAYFIGGEERVHFALADIEAADCCVLMTASPSSIQSMQVWYAKENFVPVFLVDPQGIARGDTWLAYCVDKVFFSTATLAAYWQSLEALRRQPRTWIGLVGKKRVGKDTIGDYLCTHYNFRRFSFAEEVKYWARRLFGYSRSDIALKPPEVRKTLQVFASEYVRGVYPDIWLEVVLRRLDRYYKVLPFEYSRVVITDVRFQNEVNRLRERGFEIAKVERYVEGEDFHISETELEKITPDCVVKNDGDFTKLFHSVDKQLLGNPFNTEKL